MLKYVSIILKFFSLGLVIAAGGFWAGGEVDRRPKYRDEQTLIGGTVWTQTIIPIGLIISSIIEEELYVFVHAYFLFAGVLLLFTTGLVLIIGEYKSMHRRDSLPTLPTPVERPSYDKIYLGIGILSLLAGIFTFIDFLIIIICR
ncbi:uncharacterized protein [Epargyreus clarus]|uniref:uncharacterized protein n=1 Tax=Epargyreus clarus TaxID=520877 RepID=UPI003C2B851C